MALFLASVPRWLTAALTAPGDLSPVEGALALAELGIGLGALVLVRRLGRSRPRTRAGEVELPEAA